MTDKREYVRRAPNHDLSHHCHWPGCRAQVKPAVWGCRRHWMMLPKYLRDKIWLAFRPGQEVTKTPSRAYIEVAREVQDWIKSRDKPRLKYDL